MSGKPGPIPMRSEERQRRNEPEQPILSTTVEDIEAANLPFPIELNPTPPAKDVVYERWHPLAKELWDSLVKSPESMWMTSAGWALARIMVEQLDRELKPQYVGTRPGGWVEDPDDPESKVWDAGGPIIEVIPMKGATLAAHHKIWASMGLLEGDRRRMGREVTLHPARPSGDGPLPDGVTPITKNRAELLRPRDES